MSKQTINLGTAPTGAGGDTPRGAFTKAQSNFDEIYVALGGTTLPTALPVTKGGTGATTVAAARTALGLKSAALADIVGTVSQVSSIPTGAVIESGTNANGFYIKYADGTMICRQVGGQSVTNNAGAGVYYSAAVTFVFPVPFAGNTPSVSLGTLTANGYFVWAAVEGPSTASAITARCVSCIPTTTAYLCYNAIGRWY